MSICTTIWTWTTVSQTSAADCGATRTPSRALCRLRWPFWKLNENPNSGNTQSRTQWRFFTAFVSFCHNQPGLATSDGLKWWQWGPRFSVWPVTLHLSARIDPTLGGHRVVEFCFGKGFWGFMNLKKRGPSFCFYQIRWSLCLFKCFLWTDSDCSLCLCGFCLMPPTAQRRWIAYEWMCVNATSLFSTILSMNQAKQQGFLQQKFWKDSESSPLALQRPKPGLNWYWRMLLSKYILKIQSKISVHFLKKIK